jgi:hypothetical protein
LRKVPEENVWTRYGERKRRVRIDFTKRCFIMCNLRQMLFTIMKLRRTGRMENVGWIKVLRNILRTAIRKSEGKRQFNKPRSRCEESNKINLTEETCKGVD